MGMWIYTSASGSVEALLTPKKAIDIADRFPQAIVRGIDLSPPPNDCVPPNCILEVDNMCKVSLATPTLTFTLTVNGSSDSCLRPSTQNFLRSHPHPSPPRRDLLRRMGRPTAAVTTRWLQTVGSSTWNTTSITSVTMGVCQRMPRSRIW